MASEQPSGNAALNIAAGGDDDAAAAMGYDELDQDAADRSKIMNLKFMNATSFLLTAMLVTGLVLFGVREEGVFGDQFLWMKYQTLLTPSDYVDHIWIPLFLLQGLFIFASTLHGTLKDSPLVGYQAALVSPRQSIAVHYPAVCASLLMTIYSQDYGHIFLAFLSSLLCIAVLGDILRIQTVLLAEMELLENTGAMDPCDAQLGSHASNAGGLRTTALRYAALRLPFEALAGYVLALAALYFNIFLSRLNALPTMVYLVVANLTLAGLTVAGFLALWKMECKFYGVGLSLVWYLLGVAIELHDPTQPIYNEFSDADILSTQIVAGIATTSLATILGVRVVKTVMKQKLFNCGGALRGVGSSDSKSIDVMEDNEGGLSGDYVHA